MNFFKSVFAEDPELSDSEDNPHSPSNPQPQDHQDNQDNPTDDSSTSEDIPNPMPSISAIANAWSFGGLVKTLASKSESVIETYRRDLQEFGTGLRKETDVIREVAGRAVRDLPASLEAGAAAAQESLESVGQAIDVFGNTVTEIISHGKDSILSGDYSDGEASDSKQNQNAKPYNRLDAQIRTIQCDFKTYCDEPEELDEFKDWKLGFLIEEKSGEIESLIEENAVIDEIYNEIVPSKVDGETFWSRYFFRVYKLRKAEEARAKLVKKAISGEEDEDLSWEVDDEDFVEDDGSTHKEQQEKVVVVEQKEEIPSISEDDVKEAVSDSITTSEHVEERSDVKTGSEGKIENADVSVVSNQPLLIEEEDLSWDEIEDIDETKATTSESPDKADLKKRLSSMEEEDLSWDIEDDDEPLVKS
ncbi:BSD domain-containing protein 1-like [Impatiens glandulifera]|uniref:BSD domain-containing protein 1-like n=1 Tax=Impatiens glandulifera TaxID=253017 RepID=UPI001FB0E690|nr:BSD domain-containing protein 1-like [Impatiens glandulifera]